MSWTIGIAAVLIAGYFAARFAFARWRRFDFRDRVVAITGGSRGLGLLMARILAKEGARIALCARDEGELKRAEEELLRRGAEVHTHVCDLTQPDAAATFLQSVKNRFGSVDVLINNAGIIQVGPYESMTHEDYERAMAIHFWAPLKAIESVIPEMRQRGQGRIVNIASIGGKTSVPHLLPYCASKFALVGLSQGLRAELSKDGIYVTTVSPGMMRTGSPRHALFKGRHRSEYAWFSIGGSLPLVSMAADRAASSIIRACRFGKADLTLSAPAKFGTGLTAIAPQLTAALKSLANRLLPAAGGIGAQVREGRESQSMWSPSLLTSLSDKAARRNNEIQPNEFAVAGRRMEE